MKEEIIIKAMSESRDQFVAVKQDIIKIENKLKEEVKYFEKVSKYLRRSLTITLLMVIFLCLTIIF